MCSLTKDLAKTILEVGDYDLQVALSEALCRLITKKWRDDLVHNWFEDDYLAEAFKEIKDREFETVKKPSDEKLEEFWIDFNVGSQCVSFYIDSTEGALWDSVRLPTETVSSYSLREDNGEKMVKIYLKNPTMINGKEVTKIKIHFNAKFDILNTLNEVLGEDKMMAKCEAAVSQTLSAKKSKTPSPKLNDKTRMNSYDFENSSDSLNYEKKYEEVSSKFPGEDKVSKFKRKGSGRESDDSDDTFVSKILHEDVSDSGVIAAFESFTNQLTKTFWSRYKRMEICAKNALKTSEKSVSALLYQIHQCRLNKLENFHKVVVQELANLEKDTQILSILEKDTVDFWNKQSIKLSSFCNHQRQRIQTMDSVLEETVRSFKDTIQNTTYEHPQEKVEENSKVFVVASD
ncbi:unnamed protein product [Caretta caretta]